MKVNDKGVVPWVCAGFYAHSFIPSSASGGRSRPFCQWVQRLFRFGDVKKESAVISECRYDRQLQVALDDCPIESKC